MTGGQGLCLTKFEVQAGYSTSDSALLDDFLIPALDSSIRYDRSVGFFSSALIALASATVADFVLRGGKMRLVCSPYLSATDLAWLSTKGAPVPVEEGALADGLRALATVDDLAAALIKAMSSLVYHGVLEVKFARPALGQGLFHDKVGILTDACGHRLSFVGSANETAAAWSGLGNHEQIETFGSWLGPEQQARSERHAMQFQEMWLDVRRGVRVSDTGESQALLLEVAQPETVEVAIERVRDIVRQRESRRPATKVKPRELRPHQMGVLESWRDRERSGIVVFATGGGKTLAGLAAAREWLDLGNPVLIGVPSTLLLEQWRKEIEAELPEASVLLAGGDHPRKVWERDLHLFTQSDPTLGPRITLTTYDTAVAPDFLALVQGGPHLMVMADEVHRLGAENRRKLLTIDSGARMGLSATPERYGDVEGTKAIFDYFGERLHPEFGIKEAIAAGQLVPYDYDFVTVTLTDPEQEAWDNLSAQMAQELARNDGDVTEKLMWLALQRSRILKAASNKADVARIVLNERYRPGDRWLVYCESRAHLASVRQAIEVSGRRVFEYHSGNSHLSDEIFACFEAGGVLLAIKCLDEGVDLPFINRALILASTTNPREYIQRRGRVLRTSPGKQSAQVVDVIVVDRDGLPLAISEALRAIEFAENADNRAGRARLETMVHYALGDNVETRDRLVVESEGA